MSCRSVNAWVHRDSVPQAHWLGWLGYMVGIQIVRAAIARKTFADSDVPSRPALWRNLHILITACYGAGWGAMMFLLDTGRLDFLFMFKFATVAAVLGITLNVLSVVLPVYLALVAPLVVLLSTFIFSGVPYIESDAAWTLFIGVAVYSALLVVSAMDAARLSRVGFEQGFEREAVLAAAQASHRRELALRERVTVLAQQDALTGAFNRRHLGMELERQVQILQRYGTQFSVILLDVDHFKAVNDTFGHQVGDRVLIGLTRLITAALRDSDIFGRWGGEEFLCILPSTPYDEAMLCAERLRHQLEETRLESSLPDLVVTASFGVVVCRDREEIEVVMNRVDTALYQAKSDGRNRVVGLPEAST